MCRPLCGAAPWRHTLQPHQNNLCESHTTDTHASTVLVSTSLVYEVIHKSKLPASPFYVNSMVEHNELHTNVANVLDTD